MSEIKVPEYFPEGCKDEELKQLMKDLTNGFYPTVVASEMIRVASLIQLGQNELHNRQTQRINNISRRISWVAVAISSLSLIAILVFSSLSYQTSNRWEANQTKLLKEAMKSFAEIKTIMIDQGSAIDVHLNKNEELIKEISDDLKKDKK